MKISMALNLNFVNFPDLTCPKVNVLFMVKYNFNDDFDNVDIKYSAYEKNFNNFTYENFSSYNK